ncbi:hypothetical protein SLEP1_g42416 [Rubroshorea leprosula]|uniref:Uncharacterized protein n=1 Tax=Rubroshorea leprosula TaxID=152421 RepID=A0AAV5L9R0_9ROSI|nr:hypothetical protein SLEP1_g42416 [Rubroshorea leprosula]
MKISLISYCFAKDGKLNKSHAPYCLPVLLWLRALGSSFLFYAK